MTEPCRVPSCPVCEIHAKQAAPRAASPWKDTK